MPKYSIVIPLYNKEFHIKRSIDSVLAQTVEDFELIIVDDGSTDRSNKVVNEYSDPRIRLIWQENAGVSAARNRGIDCAKYEYISFLDADDEWKSNYLNIISELIEKYPNAGAYATGYERIGLSGKKMKKKVIYAPSPNWHGMLPNYLVLLSQGYSPIHTSAISVPRYVFKNTGKFPTNAKRFEDIDTWLRISFKYPIAYSSQICSRYYRDVENSICNTYLPKTICLEQTLTNALNRNEIDIKLKPHINNLLSKVSYAYAIRYLLANECVVARYWANKIKCKKFNLKIKRLCVLFVSFLPYTIIKFIFKFSNIKAEFRDDSGKN